jgi:hypothetical protein
MVRLLKPWSVWSSPLTEAARKGGYICDFYPAGGMYKEFNGCIFVISGEQMGSLINSGYAIKLTKPVP